MGVGGMIGGGIFSVLGVAITLAGNLAFACFVLGALLAAGTAWSYAGVTARTGRSGGPFVQLREQGHPELAGWLLWLLVFGYMVAMAVYSFTFGRYAAAAFGVDTTGARLLSIGIVVAFLLVNLRGIRVSSLTEDAIVLTKLVILAGVAAIGIGQFASSRLSPLADRGVGGLFLGAATVFFAYEGFELISYDRDDIRDPDRTVGRALLLSVGIVAAIYISVTLGAQMLVSKHDDRGQQGDRVRGGRRSGARSVRPVGRDRRRGARDRLGHQRDVVLHRPARPRRQRRPASSRPRSAARTRGLPIAALAFIALAGASMAMLPGITEVIAFGSGAFLAVYTLVNFLQARTAPRRVRTCRRLGQRGRCRGRDRRPRRRVRA